MCISYRLLLFQNHSSTDVAIIYVIAEICNEVQMSKSVLIFEKKSNKNTMGLQPKSKSAIAWK